MADLDYPEWYGCLIIDPETGKLVAGGANARRIELLIPAFAKALGKPVLAAKGTIDAPSDDEFWGEAGDDRFNFLNMAQNLAAQGQLPGCGGWLIGLGRRPLDLTGRNYPGGKPKGASATGDRERDLLLGRVDSEVEKIIAASAGKKTVVEARSEYFRRCPEVYESYRCATTISRGGGAR